MGTSSDEYVAFEEKVRRTMYFDNMSPHVAKEVKKLAQKQAAKIAFMHKEKQENDLEKTITPSSFYFLGASDNPGTPLATMSLRGDNYRNWARSMRTTLHAKTKIGFIDGSIKKPPARSPEFLHWEKVDSMVIAWIINSTDPSLHMSISQEPIMIVTDFYTKFKSLLDELGDFQPLPECTCGASKELAQREEEQHIHLFLGGIDNDRYHNVKGTILNVDPLPPL
ncbi:Gag-polypeptide of LTR copia-type [Sesbania bispinosa]|nr:Gag-polypeptide of LTR copia-type [Sesbania bispinosa]